MRAIVTLALLFATMAGCLQEESAETPPRGPSSVRFLAVGDTGTGGEMQYTVANAMAQVCRERGCDFVLLLGDNFYNDGVTGPDDPQFKSKFEQPYEDLGVPFYPVLGNHDYGPLRNETARAQAQVDYTSDKWTMPGRTYTFEKGPARFIALDSGSTAVSGQLDQVDEPLVAQQQAWLRGVLDESDARWHVTFAHHPYRSNGAHGDAGSFDGTIGKGAAWNDLLESACADVHLHLAGHDHDLQWLEPSEECPRTELIVSGAGAKARSDGGGTNPSRFSAFNTNGFAWLEMTSEELSAVFYDHRGALLYENRVKVPSKS